MSPDGPPHDPEAIVFDFDGVILESGEIKTRAFEQLFADRPEHRAAVREHHLSHLGLSRFAKFRWIYRELFGEELTPEGEERLGREYSRLVLDGVLACPLVPGARELLEALRGRVPLFVASGTPQDELRFVVRRRGLERYFDGVWGSPDSKSSILRRVLALTGLAPDQVLLVGDGLSDLEAARSEGVAFVARQGADQPLQPWPGEVRVVPDLAALAARLGPLAEAVDPPAERTRERRRPRGERRWSDR